MCRLAQPQLVLKAEKGADARAGITDRMELGIAASPGVVANMCRLTLVLQRHPGYPWEFP